MAEERSTHQEKFDFVRALRGRVNCLARQDGVKGMHLKHSMWVGENVSFPPSANKLRRYALTLNVSGDTERTEGKREVGRLALERACQAHDTNGVVRILNERVSGWPPLAMQSSIKYAAKFGHVEMVDALLKTINATELNMMLHNIITLGAQNGRLLLVETYVPHPQLEGLPELLPRAFDEACNKMHYGVATFLWNLMTTMDINMQAIAFETKLSLEKACKYVFIEMVEFLVNKVNVPGFQNGRSIRRYLDAAIKAPPFHACVAILRTLLSGYGRETWDDDDIGYVLNTACVEGKLDIVKSLLYDWGVTHPSSCLRKALKSAVKRLHVSCVEELLKFGVDPNEGTPIHFINWDGGRDRRLGTLRCLLKHGADPNACMDNQPVPCIYKAVYVSALVEVQELIKAGANPNVLANLKHGSWQSTTAETFPGVWTTPLKCALRLGSEEMIRVLLEGGANPHQETSLTVAQEVQARIDRHGHLSRLSLSEGTTKLLLG